MIASQIERFHQQGYWVVNNLLKSEQISQIVDRCDRLFNTQFETGIYPDEWYGRPGLSQSNATRQMTGLWRCDRTLASFSLSAEIARLNAALMGWQSARYGLDTFWAQPPDAPEIYFHRNSTYVTSLAPSAIITCWIALSDTTAETSLLAIVPGSHQWQCTDKIRFLHAPKEDYRTPLWQAAAEAKIDPSALDILSVELSAGSAIFLHGDLWHGAGRNSSATHTRQSLAISAIAGNTQFQPPGIGAGYIFGRYRRMADLGLHESFYPILWHPSGYRTPFLAEYCEDAIAPNLL
ncbi:MAG: phytanoyl-CoA dioxygenase family protein [Phormidesmis sp.]